MTRKYMPSCPTNERSDLRVCNGKQFASQDAVPIHVNFLISLQDDAYSPLHPQSSIDSYVFLVIVVVKLCFSMKIKEN